MPTLSRRTILRSTLALSAVSLIPDLLRADEPLPPRERFLLDFNWHFIPGHASDPAKDQNFAADQGEFTKSGTHHICDPKLDLSKWTPINLPHDWAVELPFVNDRSLQGRGYKPLGRTYPATSVGWYRKTFDLPSSDLGRRISVTFDGGLRGALIFFNGYLIGRNDNGYCPFTFDLTDYVNYGAPNVLVARMDASYGDGWFYEGAGLYRHVWLEKTEAVHLGQWESYVRTEVKGSAATLTLGTLVQNDSATSASAIVRWKILDPQGKVVATASSTGETIAPDASVAFTATTQLPSPSLWSPETPILYKAVVTVESGNDSHARSTDAEQITFGVRSLRFDADKGFFLNGKSVKIKGTCNHQDHAGVGAAMPDRLQYYRLALLKQMGSNAVRTSHNMPTPEWVEACDRLGMMMMCETRLAASTPEGLAQYTVMVKRYRNSPSVILWSIGNEEWKLQFAPEGERVGRTMIQHSHELDPTRLCTLADNGDWGKGISRSLDVVGFNYNHPQIDPYHKAHPTTPLIGSETASTVATRGIYQTDKLRNWVSAYDLNFPRWAATAENWWKFYAARDFLPGGFAWTGFDYRGEPTPYGWPSISSQFGILDMCGFPKDDYFYYKAWWGTEPVLHLLPHWNWEERGGEPISVWVHSNLDSVELFLNGASQGSKKVEPLTHLEWKVPYAPGTLEARGTKSGKVVLTEKRETTGPIASLRLTPDRTSIAADGEDLVFFTVEALDAQNRLIPTADDFIKFKISGPGVFLGVGNGDPNCQEPDKKPERSLFNGLAQVILQSTRTPGELTLEAYTEDWPGPKLAPVQSTITTTQRVPRLNL